MRKVLEGVGAVIVILLTGVPGFVSLMGAVWVVDKVPPPFQGMLILLGFLAAPFWMVVTVTWTFRKIESFLRWSKLV